MKSKLLLLILTAWCTNGWSQLHLHEWNNSYYASYHSSTFKNESVIHQKINPNNIDYPLLNAAIFYRTNEERVKYGRSEFQHSPTLEQVAFNHSKDMVMYNFYSHKSPVPGKESMSDRIKSMGLNYKSCAENIYDFFLSQPSYWEMANGLVEGWMNSEGHKRNILNPELHFLGCGIYHYENPQWSGYFWVKSTQNFYTPMY